MAENGLDITEEQFMRIKLKEQNLILFKNVTYIRKRFKDYSFHRKIQYVWLSVLTSIVGIAFGFRKALGF